MPADFNPHYQWLAIPADEQPPNHYRLLGVQLFESNADVIATAADRQMAHVRTFQTGAHSAASQQVLNELAAARVCLLSTEKRAEYDRRLREQLATTRPAAADQAAVQQASAAGKANPANRAAATAGPRPLVVARPLTPAQPSVAPSAQAVAGLDFDPLASSPPPRRSRRQTSAVPVWLIALGLLSFAAAALWFTLWHREPATPKIAKSPVDKPKHASTPPESARAPALDAGSEATSASADERKARTPRKARRTSSKSAEPDDTQSLNEPPLRDETQAPDEAQSPDDAADQPPSTETADVMLSTIDEPPAERSDSDGMPVLPAAGTLLPVPEELIVKKTTEDIRELLKDRYAEARKPGVRYKLIEDMQRLAAESNSPAERYALSREIFRVAVTAKSPGLALQAVDAIAKEFAIDRYQEAADALELFAQQELPAGARDEVLDAIGPLASEAAKANRFDQAQRMLAAGLALARRTNDNELVKILGAQSKELKQLAEVAAIAQQAERDLAINPDDATAHLTLGSYLCATQQWRPGLKHLSQGSDPELKRLAQADLARPLDADAQLKVADQWWDASEQAKGPARTAWRQRAAYWYQQARVNLKGLTLTKVEKRLQEIGEIPGAGNSLPASAPKDAIYLLDLPHSELRTHNNAPLTATPERAQLWFHGVQSPHNFMLHPPEPNVSSHVSFDLRRHRVRSLTGTVGINEYIVREGSAVTKTPLTLRIVGDGRPLWRSRPLQRAGEGESFSVSIRGVKKLELLVDCPGGVDWAQSMLVDTYVSARPAQRISSSLKAGTDPPSASRAGETSGTGNSLPASAPKDAIYLLDLPHAELHNDQDMPLTATPERGQLWFHGVQSPHNFMLHPNIEPSHVAFDLSGHRVRSLNGTFGINEYIVRFGSTGSRTPLTLRIVGDGQPLWQSRPLQKAGEGESFSLSIRGVKKLELFVDCPGSSEFAQALLVDTYISARPPLRLSSSLKGHTDPPSASRAGK